MGNKASKSAFTDCVIIAGGKKFHAHKYILASSSNYFNHKISNDGSYLILDIDKDVCREMLRYIYTGEVNDLEKHADLLIAAADKYSLESLRIRCEQHYLNIVDFKTAARLLIIGDLYHSEILKQKCIEIIFENLEYVRNSEGWLSLMLFRPNLAQQFEDVTGESPVLI